MPVMEYDDLLREVAFNADGLIPVVAQQHDTGEVLMVAWMNRDAMRETLSTGQVCYWSRSRKGLWRKGETSGQTQRLVELKLDCDGDTLLARVDQVGVACHTGRRNCFFRSATSHGWEVTAEPEIPENVLYGKLAAAKKLAPGEARRARPRTKLQEKLLTSRFGPDAHDHDHDDHGHAPKHAPDAVTLPVPETSDLEPVLEATGTEYPLQAPPVRARAELPRLRMTARAQAAVPLPEPEGVADDNPANRREHSRHDIDRPIEIFHNGYAIELPGKDISLTGVGVLSCGVSHLKPGDTCLVMLDSQTEVEAEVVAARDDTLHLRFAPDAIDDLRFFLRVNVAGGDDQ